MRICGKIRIAPSAVVFALMLVILEKSVLCLVPFAAATCHELGHLFAINLCSCRTDSFELTLLGAEICTPLWDVGTPALLMIYAAGATANLISAWAVMLIFGHTAASELFVVCSLTLAAINMLPIRSLDGGCIAEVLLCKISPVHAYTVLSVISAVTLAALWLVSVYLMLMFDANISLLLFCAYMFVTLFLEME